MSMNTFDYNSIPIVLSRRGVKKCHLCGLVSGYAGFVHHLLLASLDLAPKREKTRSGLSLKGVTIMTAGRLSPLLGFESYLGHVRSYQ